MINGQSSLDLLLPITRSSWLRPCWGNSTTGPAAHRHFLLIGGASAIGLKPILTASITGPGQQPLPRDGAGGTTGGTLATGRGMGVDFDSAARRGQQRSPRGAASGAYGA
jgi:hypothetical protein